LTAIFSAAFIPVVIMGVALGVGKITATLWLKQNWDIAPWSVRTYLLTAITVLMVITSMGIFGFLSKAHSDQSLVSGDVQAKIAVYDEKIKTEKDNIDANRKILKQLDEAVDQVMARSQDEKGADKAVAIRRAQQKDRSRIVQEITQSQKTINALNEERAPIAAEVRKVEAEVGPIKYIASFVYGETDPTVLEKAVTWVIIILIIVFDPLAVILLLSSQISFQKFREIEDPEEVVTEPKEDDAEGNSPKDSVDIVKEQSTVTESPPLESSNPELDPCYKCGTPLLVMPGIGPFCPNKECDIVDGPFIEEPVIEPVQQPAEIAKPSKSIRTIISRSRKDLPEVKVFKAPNTMTSITEEVVQQKLEEPTITKPEEKQYSSGDYVTVNGQTYRRGAVPLKVEPVVDSTLYVQNEEQVQSGLWSKTKSTDKE
jgi:hypothetical protein